MDKWKIISIIFIILFLVQTVSIITLYSIGKNMVQKEDYCFLECNQLENAISFYYEDNTNECQCFDNQNKLIKTLKIT